MQRFRNYVSEHYRVRLLLSVPQLGIILLNVVTCNSLFARSDVPGVAGNHLLIWPYLFKICFGDYFYGKMVFMYVWNNEENIGIICISRPFKIRYDNSVPMTSMVTMTTLAQRPNSAQNIIHSCAPIGWEVSMLFYSNELYLHNWLK